MSELTKVARYGRHSNSDNLRDTAAAPPLFDGLVIWVRIQAMFARYLPHRTCEPGFANNSPHKPRPAARKRRRNGAASLDFVLATAVILPMVAFVLWAAPRIMNLVYEMTCVLVSWPFL